MARNQKTRGRDPIEDLYARVDTLTRELEALKGNKLFSMDRGDRVLVPAPVEGQLLTQLDEVHWWYSNGKWRTHNRARIKIKVFADDDLVATGDSAFIDCITDEDDMDMGADFELASANAYVTTVSGSGAVVVQIRNVTAAADMLSTPISIAVGTNSSYNASSTRGVVDPGNAAVTAEDLIAIDVDSAGSGAQGLGVILTLRQIV